MMTIPEPPEPPPPTKNTSIPLEALIRLWKVSVPLVKNFTLQLLFPSSITAQFPVYVKFGLVPMLSLAQLYAKI